MVRILSVSFIGPSESDLNRLFWRVFSKKNGVLLKPLAAFGAPSRKGFTSFSRDFFLCHEWISSLKHVVARIGCAAGNDVMAIGPLKVLMTEWSDDRTLNGLHLTSLGYVWPKSFDDLDLTLLLESSFHVAEIWAKCGHFTIFIQLFCCTDRLGFADEGT